MCVSESPTEEDKVTSYSRFPSEIKEGLFLGNMINVIDRGLHQIKLLGIKSVVYFAPDKFEYLENEFNCIHYAVTESK